MTRPFFPHVRFLLLLSLFCLLIPSRSEGAGFAILQQGTGPMGQGNAFVAQADDPSAVFFNPAGITRLEGTQAYLGATFIIPQITYEGADGGFEDTVAKLYVTPHIYFTHQISPSVSLGLGIFSPFGLGTVWDEKWEGRYLATYSSLTTALINPNVAFKRGRLSVSLGLDALAADLEIRRRFPLPVPFPDGGQKLTGDTWGYGYNIGVLFEASERLNLGLSFRSKIDLSFDDATARFDVPDPLTRIFPKTGASGDLTLPASVTGGVAYSPTKDLTIEFDLTWTGWSSYDEIKIGFDTPVGSPPTSVSRQPKYWRDVLAYRFGARYRLDERNTLRLGFIYDENPVPDRTFDPQLPDADRLIYTAGYDLRAGDRLTLGLAYNYIDGKGRTKSNGYPPELPEDWRAEGLYEQEIHSVGVSIRYAF